MRVGALDCGTNSLRLLIADIDGTTLTDEVRRTEIVRLGQDVDRTGALAPEALERARAVLDDYAGLLRTHRVPGMFTRLVATSAIRDASNREEFHDLVAATLGIQPEIVAGVEEAGLSFAGATRELHHGYDGLTTPPYLVIDIGGGSTELVLGSHSAEHVVSVNVGAVRLTERHLLGQRDAPPTDDAVAGVVRDVTAALDEAERTVPLREARTVVCVAGTATTVAALAQQLPHYDAGAIHHARITTDQVCAVADRLNGLTVGGITALPAVHPKRADVITAGAIILRTVLERAGAAGFVASEHDILDGIAWTISEQAGGAA